MLEHLPLDLGAPPRRRRQSRGSLAACSASLMIASITGWKPRWPNITAPSMIVFGQLVRFRLHHQHRVAGAGHDEVELRLLHLVDRRVQHVAAVDVADARRADRAHEGHAGKRQRRRGGDHRRRCRGRSPGRATARSRRPACRSCSPPAKSGRIGRSMRREVSVSFSVGRPSRLKKPPGMRPAAKYFSW